jgi:hypothetical protein
MPSGIYIRVSDKHYGRPIRTIEQCRIGLLDKVEKDENDCWNWIGNKSDTGYGRYYFEDKVQKAHRVSYKLFVGDIPQGKLICHKCNNRLCINPQHLYVGNHKDNYSDAIKAGTVYMKNGEDNPFAKLKKEQVIKIKELYIPYKVSAQKLANIFRTSRKNILHIVNNETWREG